MHAIQNAQAHEDRNRDERKLREGHVRQREDAKSNGYRHRSDRERSDDGGQRFKGDQDRSKPLDFEKAEIIPFTPRRVKAVYEIFEKLAPSLLGMQEQVDGTFKYDDIYD